MNQINTEDTSQSDLLEQEENMKRIRGDLSPYYTHTVLNEGAVNSNTISILIYASECSNQTYDTLLTFQTSQPKNIHLVVVDDSKEDCINVDYLERTGIYIDLIQIKQDNKFWVNPCVNYNIGCTFLKGDRVILQDATICHTEDIFTLVNELNNTSCYVLNTATETDKKIFLCTHRSTIERVKGFSWDYSFSVGSCYDDFLMKLKLNNIPFIYKNTSINNILSKVRSNKEDNEAIFEAKKAYIEKFNEYPECSDHLTTYRQCVKKMFRSERMDTRTIVTITGIRPDFIRMSHIFKKLDKNFKHILIHTGQHYDKMLSEVFFDELQIRKPDYTLSTGKESANHYEQLSYLAKAVPDLLKSEGIEPDLILFLGDSNTSAVAMALKKEGYSIGHIEAGMRSFDNRMLEEINRKVCDMCSDILFVYHDEYARFLEKEGITKNVYVVGNTIVEPTNDFLSEIVKLPKKKTCILVDVHRPENFQYKYRLKNILSFAEEAGKRYNLPVKLLYFKRLEDSLKKFSLEFPSIQMIPLMSYKQYLQTIYDCPFIISDSGTGQEEPALLNTPVVVPREYTERPMSYISNCSKQFRAAEYNTKEIFAWLDRFQEGTESINVSWLGDGTTSQLIINKLKDYLK